MAVKWTKTSSPSSRWMKPYPLASLNHFTFPVGIGVRFLPVKVTLLWGVSRVYRTPGERSRPAPDDGQLFHASEATATGVRRSRLHQDASRRLFPSRCAGLRPVGLVPGHAPGTRALDPRVGGRERVTGRVEEGDRDGGGLGQEEVHRPAHRPAFLARGTAYL